MATTSGESSSSAASSGLRVFGSPLNPRAAAAICRLIGGPVSSCSTITRSLALTFRRRSASTMLSVDPSLAEFPVSVMLTQIRSDLSTSAKTAPANRRSLVMLGS